MKRFICLKSYLKLWFLVILFSFTIKSHAQSSPVDSSGVYSFSCEDGGVEVISGYDYLNHQWYDTGAVDKYWKILYQQGDTLISPRVGNYAPTVWVGENYWINTNQANAGRGNYYYRLFFCVDSICPGDTAKFGGNFSADNTLKTIRIDGTVLVDFSDSSDCPGYDRLQDFRCYKNQSYIPIPTGLLSVGFHVLEVEVYNTDVVTGLAFMGLFSKFSGKILPSSYTAGVTGCAPTGQIRGAIFIDKNNIGVKDPNDINFPLPFTVNLRDSANITTILQTVTTDTNGTYNFYGLDKSKTYFLDANDVIDYALTTNRLLKVKFSSGSNIIANVDFGIAQCTISGKVYGDTDQNGQYNSGDQLLANRKMYLFLYNNSTNPLIDSAYTDVSGNYSFLVECSCKEDYPYVVLLVPKSGETIKQPSNGQPYYIVATCPNTPTADKDFGISVPPSDTTDFCAECIPSFSPLPCKDYLLSAWVKEDFVKNQFPDTYQNSGVKITFNNGADQTIPLMRPTGPIVDGWQRIEQKFTVPCTAANIQVKLVNTSASDSVYFDDVRIHPFRSNMKSFVYNPSTQKVEAILDENNYATLYEYDDEGILIRVKKETERGVMTIKESRNNQSKR